MVFTLFSNTFCPAPQLTHSKLWLSCTFSLKTEWLLDTDKAGQVSVKDANTHLHSLFLCRSLSHDISSLIILDLYFPFLWSLQCMPMNNRKKKKSRLGMGTSSRKQLTDLVSGRWCLVRIFPNQNNFNSHTCYEDRNRLSFHSLPTLGCFR